jgi:hypothetical protein
MDSIEGFAALNLYQKIARMIADAKRIPKRGTFRGETATGKEFTYPYAFHSDVVDQSSELCGKYGVVVFQHPLIDKESFFRTAVGQKGWMLTRQLFKYVIVNADKPEEKIEQLVWGEASDGGDKGAYKASTGADKYFWFRLLQLPTGDDPDDESETRDKGSRKQSQVRQGADRVQQKRDEITADGYVSEPERRAVFAAAGQADVNHDDLKRYLLETHNCDSTAKMTRKIADDVLAWLKSIQKAAEVSA